MSLFYAGEGLHPQTLQLMLDLHTVGQGLVKRADITPAYSLVGTLYLSPSGWLLLSVPAPLVRGVFSALHEPGVELPTGGDGKFTPHCSVMSKDEVALIGADRITERGKTFRYTLSRLMQLDAPAGQPELRKAFYLTVHSPELQALRRSYGLSSLPHNGEYDFHITVATIKRGVLGRNETAKA